MQSPHPSLHPIAACAPVHHLGRASPHCLMKTNLQTWSLVAGDGVGQRPLVNARPIAAQGESEFSGRSTDEFTHQILQGGGDDEVFGRILPRQHPLHAYATLGVARVARKIEVARVHELLQTISEIG